MNKLNDAPTHPPAAARPAPVGLIRHFVRWQRLPLPSLGLLRVSAASSQLCSPPSALLMADDAQPPLPAPAEGAPSTTHEPAEPTPAVSALAGTLEGLAVASDAPGSSTDEHAPQAAADASGCAMPASAYPVAAAPPLPPGEPVGAYATGADARMMGAAAGGEAHAACAMNGGPPLPPGPGPPGYGGESPVYHSGYGEGGGVAPPLPPGAGPAMMMGGYGAAVARPAGGGGRRQRAPRGDGGAVDRARLRLHQARRRLGGARAQFGAILISRLPSAARLGPSAHPPHARRSPRRSRPLRSSSATTRRSATATRWRTARRWNMLRSSTSGAARRAPSK